MQGKIKRWELVSVYLYQNVGPEYPEEPWDLEVKIYTSDEGDYIARAYQADDMGVTYNENPADVKLVYEDWIYEIEDIKASSLKKIIEMVEMKIINTKKRYL